MKLKKIKIDSLSANMLSSLICRAVTIFSSLFVQRHILIAFGSNYNGLTSLITQVMSYLVLLEAGLGAASIQAFYHPLNHQDWDEVTGILRATASSYRKVAFLFSSFLIGITLLVPLAIVGEIEFMLAAVFTLISGASNIVSYLFGGAYTALLTADQKISVTFNLTSVSTLLSAVLRIIALQNGCGIVGVQAIHLLCVLLKCITLCLYVRKKYPHLRKSAKPNFNAISKRWNVLLHNIAGLVVNHTDILILTVADSLKIVSVYSVYNMIYGQMGTVMRTTFGQAPQASFGQLLHCDKKGFERLYAIFETSFTIILFVILTLVLILTLPFVALYTQGVTDVAYLDFWLPILFSIIFFMDQVRTPALLTINATGAFKETQVGAIVEACINLVLSAILFFVFNLGIYGLLIGTICSYLYRSVDVFVYVYRNVIHRNVLSFMRSIFVNAACLCILVYLFYLKHPLHADSYLEWFMIAIGLGCLTVLFYVMFNLIFNLKNVKPVLQCITKKIKKAQ